MSREIECKSIATVIGNKRGSHDYWTARKEQQLGEYYDDDVEDSQQQPVQ